VCLRIFIYIYIVIQHHYRSIKSSTASDNSPSPLARLCLLFLPVRQVSMVIIVNRSNHIGDFYFASLHKLFAQVSHQMKTHNNNEPERVGSRRTTSVPLDASLYAMQATPLNSAVCSSRTSASKQSEYASDARAGSGVSGSLVLTGERPEL
jgi:hypothetical protein